jgi:Tfp pilus assembly protein PilO
MELNFNMDWARELQSVDFNDPSSWPVSFKGILAFALCIVILIAGYYFIIKDQGV